MFLIHVLLLTSINISIYKQFIHIYIYLYIYIYIIYLFIYIFTISICKHNIIRSLMQQRVVYESIAEQITKTLHSSIKTIQKDGNCLFRAAAFCLFGKLLLFFLFIIYLTIYNNQYIYYFYCFIYSINTPPPYLLPKATNLFILP